MATRMQQRRGTAAEWTSANPILAAGELGYETDTNQFKIGDGTTAWGSLSYFANLSAILDGAPSTLDTLNELAAAINDDPDFFDTLATDLGTKADLDSPAFTGTVDFTSATVSGLDLLPDQTSHSGQFLTTDGSTASWATVDALPSQTGNDGKYLTTDGSSASWADAAAPRPHPFTMIG